MRKAFLLKLVADVGHKSHKSCSLDSDSQLTLMLCTGAGNAAGKNLCALGGKLAKTCSILVIDVLYLILAELADLLLSAVVLTELTLTLGSFVSIHLNTPYLRSINFLHVSNRGSCLEGEIVVVGNFLKLGSTGIVKAGKHL